jgi:hypothetical protein
MVIEGDDRDLIEIGSRLRTLSWKKITSKFKESIQLKDISEINSHRRWTKFSEILFTSTFPPESDVGKLLVILSDKDVITQFKSVYGIGTND